LFGVLRSLYHYSFWIRVITEGVFKGFKTVLLGCTLWFFLCFIQGLFMRRQVFELDVLPADDNIDLLKSFYLSSLLQSIFKIGYCSIRSCQLPDGQTLMMVVRQKMGVVYFLFGVFFQIVVFMGIFNLVMSAFMVEAMSESRAIKEQEKLEKRHKDIELTGQAEKLMRAIAHAGRKDDEEKDDDDPGAASSKKHGIMAILQEDVQAGKIKVNDGDLSNLEELILAFASQIEKSVHMYSQAYQHYNGFEPLFFGRLQEMESESLRYVRNGPGGHPPTWYYSQERGWSWLRRAESCANDNTARRRLSMVGGSGSMEGSAVQLLHDSEAIVMSEQDYVVKDLRLRQETEDLNELIEEAKEAQMALKELIAPGSDWANEPPGAGNSGDLRKVHGAIADSAIDPGVKSMARCRVKADQKYGGDASRNHDYARLSLIYETAQGLLHGLECLRKCAAPQKDLGFGRGKSIAQKVAKGLGRPLVTSRSGTKSADAVSTEGHEPYAMFGRFRSTKKSDKNEDVRHSVDANSRTASELAVVAFENRFSHQYATAMGWRDLSLKVEMQMQSGRYHIAELQLQLAVYAGAREEAHVLYEAVREKMPEDTILRILDRLTANQTLDLGLKREEYFDCIKNQDVRELLDRLGIAELDRLDLFDVLDANGDHSLSSSELRDGLVRVRGQPRTADVVATRLMVKSIQGEVHVELPQKLEALGKHLRRVEGKLDDIHDFIENTRMDTEAQAKQSELKRVEDYAKGVESQLQDFRSEVDSNLHRIDRRVEDLTTAVREVLGHFQAANNNQPVCFQQRRGACSVESYPTAQ
jgi:hypothetical protein